MKQAVTVEQEIAGKADAIWATISSGGDVHQWFPIIQSCRLEGSGEGASRFCTMIDGTELKERIVEVNHATRRFRYAIDRHPLPAQDVVASSYNTLLTYLRNAS
ncbi:SRPBCC family protein [Pleurocapsales cyanobacterium LEGE 06147]|nr:SRPBCC family protein [Pleurocapsales cyanobacterium LEGE 06147]